MTDLDSIWTATLNQLTPHLDAETMMRLRGECRLLGQDTTETGLRFNLGVNQVDTLSLVRHKLSRPLVQYLGVISGEPVELAIQFTGDGTPAMRNFLKVLTAHHVLTSTWPEPIWVIPELLPAGLTLLAGRQKVGKSWLAMQVCRAICYGDKLWDRDVPTGSFLYLALEDYPRRLQGRMKKQGWTPNGRLQTSGFILRESFEEQIGYLDEEGSQILAEQIERQKPRLVVIDTLGRAVRGDVNDYEVMTAALSPIQQMALAKNVGIIIVDHHRKLFSGDIDVVVDVLGSSAKAAVADTIMGLYKQRGSKAVKLGVVGRDTEDMTMTLEMDENGLWQKTDAEAIEITARRQEILDILKALGTATLAEITAATELKNGGSTYTRLADLIDAELVTRNSAPGQAATFALRNGSTPDGHPAVSAS